VRSTRRPRSGSPTPRSATASKSRAPYTPEQIADLFELLSRLGGARGMIRQSEFFLYTAKDRRAVELCREKGLRHPEITGWIRASLDDYRLVKAAGLRETGMLASISDYHIYRKMASDRRTVLDGYLKVVEAALADGVVRAFISRTPRAPTCTASSCRSCGA